jgi:4-amino-4-deoxy-L-arabinose transferase-like glycosyltransferase
MTDQKSLRESLFDAEPISADRQQRFHAELDRIREPRLPPSHRIYYTISLVCSLIGLLGAVPGFIFDGRHRWMWGLFSLTLCASAVWYFHILRRGAEPMRKMQTMSKAMAGIGMIVAGAFILYGLHNPSLAGVLWALAGLLLALSTNVINLWNRVITAERTLREDILRVEYRLADLGGKSKE